MFRDPFSAVIGFGALFLGMPQETIIALGI